MDKSCSKTLRSIEVTNQWLGRGLVIPYVNVAKDGAKPYLDDDDVDPYHEYNYMSAPRAFANPPIDEPPPLRLKLIRKSLGVVNCISQVESRFGKLVGSV